MSMNEEQLQRLEALAAVHVAPERREKILQDLGSIMAYVDQLQAVEVPAQDLARTPVVAAALREDQEQALSDTARQALLDAFPAKTTDDLLEAHGALESSTL